MLPVCSLSLILVLSLTADWSWVSLYVPGYNEQLDLDTLIDPSILCTQPVVVGVGSLATVVDMLAR